MPQFYSVARMQFGLLFSAAGELYIHGVPFASALLTGYPPP
jgi:hypothetical protein